MAEERKIGNIEGFYEEKHFEWIVTNFFSIAEHNEEWIESPVFHFARASFYLCLIPKSTSKPGFSILFLKIVTKCKYSVEYDFALKRLDVNVETSGKKILTTGAWISDCFYFKSLEKRKCEEASLDVLRITCKLKCERTNSNQPSILKEPEFVELIKLDTLSENLKNLLANRESCDTTLLVQDREYKAHRALLIARSPVFAAMFLHETSEKQTGLVTISDCDPESFEEFMEYLYSGKLNEPSSRNAIHLYKTSDKYEILELKTFCVKFLMGNLTVENFCDIVILAEKYDEENLLNAAQCFFNKNLDKILEISEWDCLVKNNYRLSKRLLIEMWKAKHVE